MLNKYSCRPNLLLLLTFSLFTFHVSRAQWYEPDKVNKKAIGLHLKAYDEASAKNYTAALQHVNEAIVIDPKFVDAFLSRAGFYADLKNYPASVNDFENALRLDSIYSKTFFLPYSISLAGAGKFQQALDAVTAFLQNPTLNPRSIKAGNYRKSTYAFAVDYEKKHPSNNYIFAPL